MPAVTDDAVARAAQVVPRAHSTGHPRLGRVRQGTAQTAIERDLRRAGIQPRLADTAGAAVVTARARGISAQEARR